MYDLKVGDKFVYANNNLLTITETDENSVYFKDEEDREGAVSTGFWIDNIIQGRLVIQRDITMTIRRKV